MEALLQDYLKELPLLGLFVLFAGLMLRYMLKEMRAKDEHVDKISERFANSMDDHTKASKEMLERNTEVLGRCSANLERSSRALERLANGH